MNEITKEEALLNAGFTAEEIKVMLRKLSNVTTKDIDASIKATQPKRPVKAETVTTTSMPDLADIAEKKRRDAIMVEKKEWEKKIKMAKRIKPNKKPDKFFDHSYQNAVEALKEISIKDDKKLAMKEKMAKVRAAKGKKE